MPDSIHVHIDIEGPGYEAARYVFQVLLGAIEGPIVFNRGHPSVPPDGVLITYGPARLERRHPRHLQICAARRLWEHYGKDASLPPFPSARIPVTALGTTPTVRLEDPLILPYVSEGAPAAVELGPAASSGSVEWIATGADLIASTFFWLTRYEESFIGERDAVGRVPHERLRVLQEGLNTRPLVDEYAELLITWLRMLGLRVGSTRPPFRAMLTHDVDFGIGVRGVRKHAEHGLRSFYRELVRQRRPRSALRGLGQWALRGLGIRDEATLFGDIVRLDGEFGFPSFFFLMANGTNPRDASYDILGDAARGVIAAIRSAGGSIGLHVGLDVHGAPARLQEEWDRLLQADPRARPVSRSHYLAFLAPTTWRRLVERGFTMDSTLGFSHHIGFRAGTCRAFKPFDFERGEVLSLWELPMALMDMNLFHHGQERYYERELDLTRIAAVRDLSARVKAHGGCLVINWHNISFFGHYLTVYRAILETLRGAQPLSPEDVPAAEGAVIW
jgi:hypothetical protein